MKTTNQTILSNLLCMRELCIASIDYKLTMLDGLEEQIAEQRAKMAQEKSAQPVFSAEEE